MESHPSYLKFVTIICDENEKIEDFKLELESEMAKFFKAKGRKFGEVKDEVMGKTADEKVLKKYFEKYLQNIKKIAIVEGNDIKRCGILQHAVLLTYCICA